jgi:hypothetical protein
MGVLVIFPMLLAFMGIGTLIVLRLDARQAARQAERAKDTLRLKRINREASKVNLPQRPHESVDDWDARVSVAMDELGAAQDEFIEAAMREGGLKMLEERAMVFVLPYEHHASIRLARAHGRSVVRTRPYRGRQ